MPARRSAPARLGLIVNPLAGIGGPAALRGSDGCEIVAAALKAGARPQAGARAAAAMAAFRQAGGEAILTGPGALGADAAAGAEIFGLEPAGDAGDTRALVTAMQGRADLILFAGGDGTARDVQAANGGNLPVLGIPAGVKMHSGIFARTPQRAGQLAAAFLTSAVRRCTAAEVMDVDEAARRGGRLSATLHGLARTPEAPGWLQGPKQAGAVGVLEIDAALGAYAAAMRDDVLYLIGPGTTMAALKDRLGGGTLLGVDAAQGARIIARDLNAAAIGGMLAAARPARIVLGVIGGQGFLFGRGNQQLGAEAIRRVGLEGIDVICAGAKLAALAGRPLAVDTGDPALDRDLAGYRQIITGPGRRQVVRVSD